MIRLSALLPTLAIMSLMACGDTSQYHDSAEKQKMLQQQLELFNTHKAKWRAANLLNYEYTRSIECNCEDQRDVVVSIVDGQVDNAYFNNGSGKVNESLIRSKYNEYVNIEDFFRMIKNAIQHHYDVIDIKYNEEYGYPTDMKLVQDNTKTQNAIAFHIGEIKMRYTISFPPQQQK